MSEEKRLTLEQALELTRWDSDYKHHRNMTWHLDSASELYLNRDEDFEHETYGDLMDYLRGVWENCIYMDELATKETEKILGDYGKYTGCTEVWDNLHEEKCREEVEAMIAREIADGTIEIYAIQKGE